jgi:hypothetical protein
MRINIMGTDSECSNWLAIPRYRVLELTLPLDINAVNKVHPSILPPLMSTVWLL